MEKSKDIMDFKKLNILKHVMNHLKEGLTVSGKLSNIPRRVDSVTTLDTFLCNMVITRVQDTYILFKNYQLHQKKEIVPMAAGMGKFWKGYNNGN